jgi:multidrug efflux pump subunit AcrA (membrane-fusion protein)
MPDETTQGGEQTTELTRTADASDMQTAKDWFKAVFKLQHASIAQAQEDRQQAIADRRADRQIFLAAHQANAARIGRLEDLLLAMNVKNEVDARPVQAAPGRVDLQKFRTSGTAQSTADRSRKPSPFYVGSTAYKFFSTLRMSATRRIESRFSEISLRRLTFNCSMPTRHPTS